MSAYLIWLVASSTQQFNYLFAVLAEQSAALAASRTELSNVYCIFGLMGAGRQEPRWSEGHQCLELGSFWRRTAAATENSGLDLTPLPQGPR